MGRQARRGLCALSAVGVLAVTVPSAAAVAETTGSETMHGGLLRARDRVVGTTIAASGVFNGVGRIVERPNRPGDSNKVTRDDLVFPDGVFHIVNVNRRVSLSVN